MSYKPAIKPEVILGCNVGETLRNTRTEVQRGTRVAEVCTTVHSKLQVVRMWTERTNREKVIKAWEEKWGPLDLGRDYCEIRHVHLTMQVLTEILVYPDGV